MIREAIPHKNGGFEYLNTSSLDETATGLTVPPRANYAVIQAIEGDIRFSISGENPTIIDGFFILKEGDVLELQSKKGTELQDFKAWPHNSENATFSVQYFNV
jgi:hypothetical protein